MRILAIDYGDARTGIAVSDPDGVLTGFTTVIHSHNRETVLAEIVRLCAERGAERLVLGYPRNMDGSIGPRAELCEALAADLRARTSLPVRLWDERRSTIEAHQILSANNRHGKRRKNTVDAVAASLILESYLSYLRTQPDG